MVAPTPPPVPLSDGALDTAARVLVAGVVPPPRFGREAEVAATAAAVASQGADLADVSLPPRLAGAVARSGSAVSVRARSLDQVTSAAGLGARLVMVPAGMAAAAQEAVAGRSARDSPTGDTTVAVVVDDLATVSAARSVARRGGMPLAFDATGLAGAGAIASEASAVAAGCRVLRTTDVRRTRRVAVVMSAILAAHHPGRVPSTDEDDSIDGGRRR